MTTWASQYIATLARGADVSFRPRGNSMQPRIHSGDLVTCTPVHAATVVNVGDAVLCTVQGRHYLHIVKAIDGDRYQIANARGYVNGYASRAHLHGLVTAVTR